METAAAAMLEAGVGRFSRAPAMAASLLAEMWAPLAVALAALATLPSLLRRLQVIVLRLRSRGKEVIQSHIGTYYSSCDEDDDDEDGDQDESSDDEADASSSGDEEEDLKRIGFYEGAADGVFPWGGAVVRTWQGLPRRISGCASGIGGVGGATASGGGAFPAAVRLWGASTASGGEPWWAAACSADEGGCRRDGAAAEAEADQVVVGWRREHASQQQRQRQRRRRRAVPLAHTG
ncbi:unnamed protein product [Miscanthus lutarioriparius]|uniref:Uncharacterized protein n=1 Tax=Miscanthus lutarioriparius TaxID=422564 RepID=A0A811NKR5_9POAL|nr:unnamed protein product [Miscanthus lutarioriparius]